MSITIPQFQTEDEFYDFVSKTPNKEIQKMTSKNWRELYDNLYQITDDPSDFANNHHEVFCKLYKNYRLEPQYAKYVRELAKKSAVDLLQKHPELKRQIVNTQLDLYGHRKQRLTVQIANSVYRQAFPDDTLSRVLRPRIEMKEHDFEGGYNALKHAIHIIPKSHDIIGTAAHEIFHSGHGISPIHNTLEKLGQKPGFENEGMRDLYDWNDLFYINANENSSKLQVRAYSRQPMEYGARYFAAHFEREVMHQLGVEKFDLTMPKCAAVMLDFYGIRAQGYDINPKEMRVVMPKLEPQQAFLLQELNEKYLLADVSECNGHMVLMFPRDHVNKKRMEAQAEELHEAKQKAMEEKRSFWRDTVPDTVEKYGIPETLTKLERKIRSKTRRIKDHINFAKDMIAYKFERDGR